MAYRHGTNRHAIWTVFVNEQGEIRRIDIFTAIPNPMTGRLLQ